MPKKQPLAPSTILIFVGGIALQFIFKEAGIAVLVEGVIDKIAHWMGFERAPLMASVANLLIPFAVAGVALYAAYRIGANERALGYAPHLEVPLYEAAVEAYGSLRSRMGCSAISSSLTPRNVGGSPTPGNHDAETGLGGWAGRIRTCKRRANALPSAWCDNNRVRQKGTADGLLLLLFRQGAHPKRAGHAFSCSSSLAGDFPRPPSRVPYAHDLNNWS